MNFILTICRYSYQIRHAIEEARTRNATATLNMLLKNYDKRLRPKFGGKLSNYPFYVPKLRTPLNNNTLLMLRGFKFISLSMNLSLRKYVNGNVQYISGTTRLEKLKTC